MTRARVGTIGMLCGVLGSSMLSGGDFSSYRGLQFGMNVSAASKQAGTKLTETRLVHQRPALIQEMEWQLRPSVLTDPATADPAREGLLCFFNGELFRIVVIYDRYKVEGMTAEDMIEAISATYGTASRPTAEIAYHSNYAEVRARYVDSPEHHLARGARHGHRRSHRIRSLPLFPEAQPPLQRRANLPVGGFTRLRLI